MHQQEIKSTLHYGLNASRHRKKVSMKINLEQELVKQAVSAFGYFMCLNTI